jgi:carbon storage regulator CsrA
MLLITRKRGEGFQVGPDIHICVRSVEFGNVTIGITAPKNVDIARDEIAGRPKKNKPSPLQSTEVPLEVADALVDR